MSYYVEMIRVSSSVIRAVWYDGSTLTIEFRSGRTYDHPHVPYSVYAGLMRASSKGAYYNQKIRGGIDEGEGSRQSRVGETRARNSEVRRQKAGPKSTT